MTPHAPMRRRLALVAEDHDIYRMGLANLLERRCRFETVIPTASLDEALKIVGEIEDIDLVTFDLDMPGMHGASSLLGIRQACPDLVSIVVTASEQRDDILAALAAGAHGYVPKSLAMDGMVEAFETVLGGRIYVPWSVSALPRIAEGDHEVPAVVPDRMLPRLTARQQDVLRLLRTKRSNKQIARELGLTENTVKAHTVSLYRALGIRGRSDVAEANTTHL